MAPNFPEKLTVFISLFVRYCGQYIKPQDVEVQLNCITVQISI